MPSLWYDARIVKSLLHVLENVGYVFAIASYGARMIFAVTENGERMYNYKSPIETAMLQVKSDIEKRLEDTTYKAVIECGVKVDKDELIKALAYDRGQYDEGYRDGYRAAKAEIVRCKDCKYWERGDCYRLELSRPDDFCSYGEREENAD